MQSQRQLGFASATALVVASMVGTGVFTTSGFLLADLKSPWIVLAAWTLGGVIATLGALSYGALARRIPESGGEYVFLSRTLHPAAGYLAGWVSLLVGFSAPLAAAAFAFGSYSKTWLPGWPPQLIGTALIVLFSAVHAAHVQRGAWLQNIAVLIKVALIAGFAVLACARLPEALPITSDSAPISIFAVSLVWVSFSYSGWNAAIYIGGEVRDPERTLPRSLLVGTTLVMVLYVGLNAVFLFAAPAEKLSGQLEVGRIAAQALGGKVWAETVSGLVALVLISTISAMIMAGPRVYARMAADGYLPRWFTAKNGPPRTAIALQAILALGLLWTSQYDSLLTYIGFTLGLSTAATVVGLIKLRLRDTTLLVPGWPWVPMLFLLFVIWMTIFTIKAKPLQSSIGLGTILIGWLAWRFLPQETHLRKVDVK